MHVTDRLSDYLDGELTDAHASEVSRHLGGCADCRSVLEELRDVRDRAAALEAPPPPRDLWPGIEPRLRGRSAGRISPGPRRRSFTLSVPQLAAAGLALASIGALAAWLAVGAAAPPAPAVATGEGTPAGALGPASLTSLPSGSAALGLEQAVADMQALLKSGEDALDPATVEVLERNLSIIDAAIAEIRAALGQDPGSLYLNRALTSALRRKLDVLTVAATAAAI